MKQIINVIMLIGLAASLVWSAIQAAFTMQAGWFILLGVDWNRLDKFKFLSGEKMNKVYKIGILLIYLMLIIVITVLARIGLYSLNLNTFNRTIGECYLYVYIFMTIAPVIWILSLAKEVK